MSVIGPVQSRYREAVQEQTNRWTASMHNNTHKLFISWMTNWLCLCLCYRVARKVKPKFTVHTF